MSIDLPKWEVFDKYGPYIDGHRFGLLTTTGNINRLNARYRAARGLDDLTINELHPDTSRGYYALTKMLYTYSAFESFLKAIGIKQKKLKSLLSKYPVDDWVKELKTRDNDDRLFTFVLKFVNSQHRHHISHYISNSDFNYSFLASGIRHTFVHGILSPSANECPVGHVASVCEVLWESLFQIMDNEFSERMDELNRVASAT